MPPKIIYEDENVIIVDKPASFPVHATHEKDKRETLVSFLLQHHPPLKNVGEPLTSSRPKDEARPGRAARRVPLRPGIVHRLDKETSGLMVVAKNNDTFFELKKQFRERKVEKKYISLVSGVLEKDAGVIETPLTKLGPRTSATPRYHKDTIVTKWYNGSKNKNNHERPETSDNKARGREAVTHFKILKKYREYTLVEVMPKTGRMHQIRVHFASINHPVACDKLYGRRSKKCPPGLRRHFLHASYLRFRLKNVLMEFDSQLPKDLEDALLWIKS